MEHWRKYKIGVFGSAAGDIEDLKPKARIIGREIAKAGGILINGGCPGLPHEVALGAEEENGIIIGFSPAINQREHIEIGFPVEPHILIFSGMEKKGRNVISTRSCDAIILISGRNGTMSEFVNYYDEAPENSVIGMLAGTGGVVDNVIPGYLEFLKNDKPTKAKIVSSTNPQELVQQVFKALESLLI